MKNNCEDCLKLKIEIDELKERLNKPNNNKEALYALDYLIKYNIPSMYFKNEVARRNVEIIRKALLGDWKWKFTNLKK